MKELFLQAPALIIFLHVISAVIWIGGMVAIRFAIHYSMQNILEPKIKLGRTLENLKRFFQVYPADKNIMYANYLLSIIYELICYFEFFFVDFSVRFAL